MKWTGLILALAMLAWPTCGYAAQSGGVPVTTPAPTATPSAPEYNDPAMHFVAPKDYYAAPIAPHDPQAFDTPATVALFVKNPGKEDIRVISIAMENYDGTLDGFEVNSENTAREQIDGVFVTHKERTTLSNGMPAYWVEMSFGNGFQSQKRYQYEWVDGIRGVTVSISGRLGEVDRQTAREALKDLSATLYPIRRV